MGWSNAGGWQQHGWGRAVAAAATFATWDPAFLSSRVALSGGNLIATTTSPPTPYGNTRGTKSATSGLIYWELTASNNITFSQVGVVTSSFTTDSNLVAAGTVSYQSDGNYWVNGAGPIGTLATWTDGDVLSGALNVTNKRIWFRVNAGNWNNDVSADPASNVNGIDVSSISGAFYPGVAIWGDGAGFTANFGATAYAQSVPSGFGNW